MVMAINVATNLPEVREALILSGKQARFAIAGALNDVAFKARTGMQEEMGRVFDRPSAYTLKSVYVTRKATRGDLTVEVMPTYFGGKGVDPRTSFARRHLAVSENSSAARWACDLLASCRRACSPPCRAIQCLSTWMHTATTRAASCARCCRISRPSVSRATGAI